MSAADVVCIASFNADLVCRVPRPPARGETLAAHSFDIQPGGKGSNAAVACARQGAAVAVIARIGNDDFGRMALALWAREGIDASAVEVAAGERTGIAQILVYDDGDNSIAVAANAGAALAPRHVRIARARVVMASCEVPLAATEAAFVQARAQGAVTLLNPAPALPLPATLWPLIDVLTPNAGELLTLAGGTASGEADADATSDGDVAAAAAQLLARGPRAVLVTLGARGGVLFRTGEPPLTWPSPAVTVVDTIGAGDTFTGALAAALARGEPIDAAARWANAAAALAVTGRGAIGAMPTRAQVAALLAA